MDEVKDLVQFCQRQEVKLYIRKYQHVLNDNHPRVISNMIKVLKKQGVKFVCQTKVKQILTEDSQVVGLKTEDKTYKADQYLLAPGRVGAKWLQSQAKKIGLDYSYQKVKIGVRVEFPAGIMAEHSKIMHKNIYSVQTPSFDDTVQTFCPCPNSRAAVEKYGNYIAINGYSNAKNTSPNSNFNLATEIQLTDPVENTTNYAIFSS